MRSPIPIFIIVAALLIMAAPGASHPMALNQYQITFEQIPSPHFGRTLTILRDDRGFLWLGTSKGLCKYDGYQIRVFTIGDPLDIEQQVVSSMMRLDSVSFLLATGKGLWTFNLKSEQSSPFLPEAEVSEKQINAIIGGSEGMIWIGTSSSGLISYNCITGGIQHYTTSKGLSSNGIRCLLHDRSGRLWIGTANGGLNMLERGSSHIEHYRSNAADPGTLLSDNITALCENSNQELWIGTAEGLNVLNLETRSMERKDLHSDIKHSIMSITQDPAGRMWIAALDLGVLTYSNGVFSPFVSSLDAGRSLNSVRALYADQIASTGKSLLLWMGTRNGINKVMLLASPFSRHIRNQDSLLLDRGAVLSLFEDRKGILWAGLWGGGLNGFQRVNGRLRRIANFKNDPQNPTSLPNNDVGSIIEDRNGNLWVGTAGGLAMLDKNREQVVVFKHAEGDSNSLVNNHVENVYENRSGTLWVCTLGGLSRLIQRTPPRFGNYLLKPKASDPVEGRHVSDIMEDHNSNLWVATYGRGLNKLRADGTYERFFHSGDSSGIRENWIYCLVEDHDGLFWLSTRVGLVSFDPRSGRFMQHSIGQLSDAHIFGIFVDRKNELWLSTEIGLARFIPKSSTFTKFDETYGISFSELLSGFYEDTHGTLFVGGLDGFTEFNPDSISIESRIPEIAITAFSLFDRELPASTLQTREVHLSHDQNFLSFSFAALDYANPRQNRFAYRMIGVDKAWVQAGTRNYASYANLDPGNYVFQVRGCNSNNVWNEAGASIAFIITPPYWQTSWFRFAIALLITAIVYAAYRYRLHHLLALERLRLRIAHDLHDDLGSNLSAIAMASKAVQLMPEVTSKAKEKLSEIYATALSTSEGMKDLVWFIKPETDVLGNLVLRMKETAPSLLGDLEIDFHLPKLMDSKAISVDFKRSVFLAFKEAITNIAKHAKATRVTVNLTMENNMFEMVIRDDGKGFATDASYRGTGLLSLQKRARSIGGTCEIVSQPERGTTVNFSGRVL